MLFSTAIFASAFAGLVAASSNFTVTVGAGGLQFTPNNLTADVGDMVTFVFRAKNHSVTQSSFKDPCSPLPGGFDSGFVATPLNATDNFTSYTIMVTDQKPKWVFCAQANNVTGNHCHKGMVFSINPTPPGTNTSADAYMQRAMALGANDPPLVSAAPAGSASTSAAGAGATDASGSSSDSASGASGSSSDGASDASGSSPSGTDSAAASGATPTDGSSPSSSGSLLFPPGASTTDSASDSSATAAADQTTSASASGSSSAAPAAKSSGEKSVARRSMAVLAAVGALVVLVL